MCVFYCVTLYIKSILLHNRLTQKTYKHTPARMVDSKTGMGVFFKTYILCMFFLKFDTKIPKFFIKTNTKTSKFLYKTYIFIHNFHSNMPTFDNKSPLFVDHFVHFLMEIDLLFH